MTNADTRDTLQAGENPFEDRLRDWGTIYSRAQRIGGKIANPLRFPSWPNPVDELVDMDELACKEGWVGVLTFATASYARFAWATFVPNPSEIFRKFLLGNYRCGGRFLPKTKSPLNLIIGRGGTRVLARAATPFTRALWWWWVGASAYEAFQVTQTVMNREEACADTAKTCVIGGGVCFIPCNGVETLQAPIDFEVGYCDDGMYGGTGNGLNVEGHEFSMAGGAHIDDPHGQLVYAFLECQYGDETIESDQFTYNPQTGQYGAVVHVPNHSSDSAVIFMYVRALANIGPAGTLRCDFGNMTARKTG